ncbi:MAG TPA: hypothetical protein G4N99_07025 [Thermoflexia bacterium]|nr:hypothetical protein [Thermoflexia bacterium]
MKRIAWIIFTLLVSLTWIRAPAVAQDAGPTMSATAGFDGYCHTNAWCPVYIILSNEGADVEGELRVTGSANNPSVYGRQVVLPAHSRKGYFLHLPSANAAPYLAVQLLSGDELLASQRVAVSWLDERSRLYGVAGSDPSALNFLSDVAPAGERAAVAHLDLERLPPDALGWEGLDVLILNDVDTTALNDERLLALETWVAHGGHLIVGGGAGAARTAAGVADLLPVMVGGVRAVDSLWALGDGGVSLAAGPYAVAEAVLRDGKVIIEQEGLILLARRDYGAGAVDFVAFDAGLNPFTRWDDNVRLWESIVGMGTVGARGLAVRNVYQARDAINAIPGLELPSMLQILAFMLVYTLLIGPVNYVILRKLDRRELAWLTIPVLIAGFTGCAYLTGFQMRGSAAIVHRLAVVYVPPGAEVGRVTQVVGIFSPRRTNYDVWVTGAAVREIDSDPYSGPTGRPLRVLEEADGVTVSDLRVDVGDIQSFIAAGYASAPPIESELRLVNDAVNGLRLEGSVRNGDIPLEDAVLIVGEREQRLGDLEAGERFTVSHALYSSLTSYYGDIPERIMGSVNYWDDVMLYRRYRLLQSLFPYGEPSSLEEGVYLMGWVEEGVLLPVEVIGRPFSAAGMAFYVYELPMASLGVEGEFTIGPDLITRQVDEITGYVDVRPLGCYLDSGAEVEFRFAVFPGVELGQVDELTLDMQGNGAGGAIPPAVALWNWGTEAWDEFDAGWGQHSISNPGDYVLAPGSVRVRLTAGAEWAVQVESLTITLEGR